MSAKPKKAGKQPAARRRRRRVDMAAPEKTKGIPDSFENVIKALVQPVKPPDKEAGEDEKD